METLPTDTELSSLSALAEELYQAEEKVLLLMAQLKAATKKRDTLVMSTIPGALEAVGVLEIRTPTCKIELTDVLAVQPKAANRPLVLQAVIAAGGGALVKTTVSVPFNRGEDDKVQELVDHLQLAGLQPKHEKKIEPQTLKKYVKDRLEAGKAVDMELFGVRKFQRAKFSDGAPEAPVFDGE